MRDEAHPVELHRIQDSEQVAHAGETSDARRRCFGPSRAPKVRADHLIPVGEALPDLAPLPPVLWKSVQQDDRVTCADGGHVGTEPRRLDVPVRETRHCRHLRAEQPPSARQPSSRPSRDATTSIVPDATTFAVTVSKSRVRVWHPLAPVLSTRPSRWSARRASALSPTRASTNGPDCPGGRRRTGSARETPSSQGSPRGSPSRSARTSTTPRAP